MFLERQLAQTRKPSRHVPVSRRRTETLTKLTRLRNKQAERRRDWVEKTTTDLASRYDGVAVEALNISSMTRRVAPKEDPQNPGTFLPNGSAAKSGLTRAILGSVWGKFHTRLRDKTTVYEVPAVYTSQRCNRCGCTDPRNRESQAVFRCVTCGHTAHADINAACNIRDLATGEITCISPGTRGKAKPRELGDADLQTAT